MTYDFIFGALYQEDFFSWEIIRENNSKKRNDGVSLVLLKDTL